MAKLKVLVLSPLVLVSVMLAQTASEQQFRVRKMDVPLYPNAARWAHMSGTVQVDVKVKSGVITETHVKAVTSNMPPDGAWANQVLVTGALDNLKTWRLAPDNNGNFTTVFTYEMTDEQTPYPENPRIEMQLPTSIKLIVKRTKPTCNGPDDACREQK